MAIGAIIYHVACGFWNLYRHNSMVPNDGNENNEVELQTMSIYVHPNPCHTNTSMDALMNLEEKKPSHKLTSPTSL